MADKRRRHCVCLWLRLYNLPVIGAIILLYKRRDEVSFSVVGTAFAGGPVGLALR